jgi:hypothetical protein
MTRNVLIAAVLLASATMAGCQTDTSEYERSGYEEYCKWRAENAGLCGDGVSSGGFRRRR